MRKKNNEIRTIPEIPMRVANRFAGKTAAIINGKVVAGGRNTQEAIANALKKFPKTKEWKIGIMSIPPRDGVWVAIGGWLLRSVRADGPAVRIV